MTTDISPELLTLFEKATDISLLDTLSKVCAIASIDDIIGATFDHKMNGNQGTIINLVDSTSEHAGYWGASISHWVVPSSRMISFDESSVILPVDHPIMQKFIIQLKMSEL